MDSPSLQEIRDACADLGRGEEEDDDHYEEDEPEIDEDEEKFQGTASRRRKAGLQGTHLLHANANFKKWAPDREKQTKIALQQRQSMIDQTGLRIKSQEEAEESEKVGRTPIDFGDLDDQGKFKSRKMRIKICGRYIYDYPSERAVSRSGWLQSCLLAKNSSLYDIVKLCRHCDEFFDLNILANFQYFPAARWLVWKGDRARQQLFQLVNFASDIFMSLLI